jgi:hypothetical protein
MTMANYPDPSTLATIEVGNSYEFYAEMQQDYEPAEKRMRNYTGQMVMVLALEQERNDEEQPLLYKVRAVDGREFTAQEEELNGWDYALGQYFWSDGSYGPDHDTRFLCNEKS